MVSPCHPQFSPANWWHAQSFFSCVRSSCVGERMRASLNQLFKEPVVSRTSRYFEPNLVSVGFASLKLYNFTPDFSNPRFLETPHNSNQFRLPWDKLTLDNSSLRKFPNNSECGCQLHWHFRISRFSHFNHTTRKSQICHQTESYNDCFGLQTSMRLWLYTNCQNHQHRVNCALQSACWPLN